MELNWSSELTSVIDESRDVAAQLHQPLTTAHLLLCLFTVENLASTFLADQRVSADALLERVARRLREEENTWDQMMARAHDAAVSTRSPCVTSLHVLVALCSFPDSAAYKLIEGLDVDMGFVRATALGALVTPRDDASSPGDSSESDPVHDTVDIGAGTMTRDRRAGHAPMANVRDQAPPEPTVAPRHASGLREPLDVRRRKRAPTGTPSGATRDLAKRIFDSGKPRLPSVPPDLPLPPNVRRLAAPPREPDDGARPDERISRARLVLSEKEFPQLNKLGRNLSLLAFDGKVDPVVGRESELEQLLDILNKRRANNPLLLGEAGVGKTAVVEGLARALVGLDGPPPPRLAGRILIELEASKVVSGTGLRGSFSERIQALKEEVERADGRVIVFLDELHHWIGVGAGDGTADGAGELKTALARGTFPCVGATTFDEYVRFVESDPAFVRRFQIVRVEEPTIQQTLEILAGIQPTYESHHGVTYEFEALDAAARLTHRYLPDRRLPDKAIAALDHAGSRAQRRGNNVVDRTQVACIVAELAGLSADKLALADHERFNHLSERIGEHVIGHRAIVERVAQTLKRNYAGFVSGRPMGAFLFLGPTGVGKTEFAKAIARVLFDGDDAMTRLDMTEFMEPHTVARLVGAPPGYIGHDAGGQLTESVRRRPYQLVLLDEIEKAHPDVLNLLIQLLDEGRLTDSRGRSVDFGNVVVVMTSNLGAEEMVAPATSRRVGFGTSRDSTTADDDGEARALEAARTFFRPELWNRIPERCVFAPLTEADVRAIAELQLRDSSRRLREERRIAYEWTPDVLDLLLRLGGFDPQYGARPMRATIERVVESEVASLILGGEARPGNTISLDVIEDRLAATVR
jgi:ATP-dependent Clp protease ATP-binding subunit ClpC